MSGSSIAILPFVNLSPDPEQDYFGDGLAEEIINALTRIGGLQVTARTSSFAFKGRALDIREIGQQLGVANVLEGSIRVAGRRVRITAQLISVDDGYHLWSERFDRTLEDIFAVQDEISLVIADKIRENSAHFEIADRLVSMPSVPASVYQQFLRGRYLIQRFNLEDVPRGIALLEALTHEQPHFELPYLTLCTAYTFMGAFGIMPSKVAYGRARHYLETAPTSAAELPEYQLRLAGLAYWQDWDVTQSLLHLQQALQQQPGNAEVHLWMGLCLATTGEFAAAHPFLDAAVKLDPFSPVMINFKGMTYYLEEAYEQAAACFRRSIALDPNFHMAHVNWGAAELMSGQLEAGLQRFQNLPPSGQQDMSSLGGVTLARALMGHNRQVAEGVEALTTALDTPVGDRALFFLVLIHIALEELEKALDLLEQAVSDKMSMLIALQAEPFLKALRPYPRFQELMSTIRNGAHQNPAPPRGNTDDAISCLDMDALDKLMTEQTPFLDPQLSLRKLARLSGHHPNYLSRLINECSGRNFAEYTNTYRLQAFARKAQDPDSQQLTLLALAYECGFNSKTVFNTFCKKRTGMTPSAYWKSLQQ